MAAENSAGKQRGRPFPKGRSGNPRGKPRGARHRLSILAEQLLEADAEAVVKKVVRSAKAGNMVACRLVLERLLPPRKGRAVVLDLPKIETPTDITAAMAAVIARMGAGEISPDEAANIAAVLDLHRRSVEIVDLDRRIAALEAAKS